MKSISPPAEQLHISTFIKQPSSLKLLILSGTNIKPHELPPISHCTNLIKLDLSNNFLSQLPLNFSDFPLLKILYLHENQLSQVKIHGTHLQYVSIFKNPLSEYRGQVVESNGGIMAIDFNVVTQWERVHGVAPPFSKINWPIVQPSSALEREEDYLDMLKAQIFVIANVHRRCVRIQTLQKFIYGFLTTQKYQIIKASINVDSFMHTPGVLNAVKKWKQFTVLKRKLRAILRSKGKQFLIDNYIEMKKKQRSQSTSRIISSYLNSLRLRIKIKPPFQRQIRTYKSFLPAYRALQQQYLGFTNERNYVQQPVKLYFKNSEMQTLQKVCLFARRLFFRQKDYDLCDNFDSLFTETKRKFHIFKQKTDQIQGRVWLRDSIKSTLGFVVRQVGLNKLFALYTKKGHKHIQIKSTLKKYKITQEQHQKVLKCDQNLSAMFNKYDYLVEFEVKDFKLLKTILKILRFINSGNGSSILSTQTAYFHTQVIFDDDKKQKQKHKTTKIYIGLQFFVKRVLAANIIQRFFRRKLSQKHNVNAIQIIRFQRASVLISRWMRNLIFTHRQSSLKFRSYYQSIQKQKQMYLHLDIYMNMPAPRNILKFPTFLNERQDFYQYLHKNSQVSILQMNGRKFVKIEFQSVKQAIQAQITLHKFTYCFSYGFFISLFSLTELNDVKKLENYEKKVQKYFGIQVEIHEQKQMKKSQIIGASQSLFIWTEVDNQKNSQIFENFEKKNFNISIFIYNKHKRPLKVSCQFYWAQIPSLYKTEIIVKRQKPSFSFSIESTQKKPKNKQDFHRQSNEQQKLLFDLQSAIKSKMKAKNLKQKLKKEKQKQKQQRNRINMSTENVRKISVDSRSGSFSKSHRTRVLADFKISKLSQTLNIRAK